jgi:hypothetical protein
MESIDSMSRPEVKKVGTQIIMTQNTPTLTKCITLVSSLTLLSVGSVNATSITASTNDFVKKNNEDQDSSEKFVFKTMTTDSTSRYAYIRFDLSTALKSELTNASSVTLDMYQLATDKWNGDILQIYSLNDLANASPGSSTTESTWGTNLTWSTRPDGTSTLNNSNTTWLTTTRQISIIDNNTTVSFALDKTALNTLIAADTNNQITLILGSDKDTAGNSFASVTNTSDFPVPTLRTSYPEPSALAASTDRRSIPEPSVFAVVTGLMGLGAVIIRRRRFLNH